MTVAEQVQAAIQQKTGEINLVIREYLQIIAERQLTALGIAIGNETILWWPGLEESDHFVAWRNYFAQAYPDALFLLYRDGEVQWVERLVFFDVLGSW